MKLPETVTGTIWIGYDTRWGGPESLELYAHDMSHYSCVMLGSQEVTLTVPQVDPTLKHIEILEHKRQDVLAESQRQVDAIDDQIGKLRALTHEPEHSDA